MSDLSYPRQWFSAGKYGDSPEVKTFVRETEKCLFHFHRGKERREAKVTTYSRWYPTAEEAQAVIDQRKERTAARKADARLRDAAPELLEACKQVVAEMDGRVHSRQCLAAIAACNTAIARATGGEV